MSADSASESAGVFVRAIMKRDGELLSTAASANPAITQYRLDAAMRGLVFGHSHVTSEAIFGVEPDLREWVGWLVEQDRLLRRGLGWRQREGDLTVLRAAYRAGDLALVVGAGVSMAANMPDWNGLVIAMIDRALWHATPEHRRELADSLRTRTSGDSVAVPVGREVFFVERDEVDDVLAKALVTADAATHARLEHAKAQLEAASKKHDAAHRELDDVLAEKRPTRPFAPSSSTPRPSSRLPPSSALRRCATRDWRRRQPSATSSPPSCAGCCSTGLYTGRK